MRKNKITPLILTRNEFINSADVFPMEYSDIKARNRVIYGEDETKSLSLKNTNLRHQLEDRLRGNVSSLRQLLVASPKSKRIFESNLKILFGSLTALFRGLLRLKGVTNIPLRGDEALQKIKEEFSINITPFLDLIRLRSGEKVAARKLAREVLGSLAELIRIVDQMDLKVKKSN
jgi:hypothetical protein